MSESAEKCRILVVDDDVRVADSMVGILVAGGYDAVAAYSAEAAMKRAERLNPDVVISDIVMGPVSGIELANHVREHFPSCRILLISGMIRRDDVGRDSAIRFLPKPVSPERILEFVGSCAASRAGLHAVGEKAGLSPGTVTRPTSLRRLDGTR